MAPRVSCLTLKCTWTEKRPSLGVVSSLPSCLPVRLVVPLTVIGLRHCELGTGVLTTIGDFDGDLDVVVAACLEDEQAVSPSARSAMTARRATSPEPAGSCAAPRDRPGAS